MPEQWVTGRSMTSAKANAELVVCLVDDDPGVLQAIGRLLSADGFAVRKFSDPVNFLAHVSVSAVPLVVLDVWMEEMTGLDVQAKLARASPQTRVIMITGRKGIEVERTAMEAGASAFFIKPFDDELFLAAVRHALESPRPVE
jgi:FixJ family two-component response regulator